MGGRWTVAEHSGAEHFRPFWPCLPSGDMQFARGVGVAYGACSCLVGILASPPPLSLNLLICEMGRMMTGATHTGGPVSSAHRASRTLCSGARQGPPNIFVPSFSPSLPSFLFQSPCPSSNTYPTVTWITISFVHLQIFIPTLSQHPSSLQPPTRVDI